MSKLPTKAQLLASGQVKIVRTPAEVYGPAWAEDLQDKRGREYLRWLSRQHKGHVSHWRPLPKLKFSELPGGKRPAWMQQCFAHGILPGGKVGRISPEWSDPVKPFCDMSYSERDTYLAKWLKRKAD